MEQESKLSRRERAWIVLAPFYLDSDLRDEIPMAAFACAEGGWSAEAVRGIWRYEVTPALFWNLWDIAGEWRGWADDFVVSSVRKARGRRWNRPGAFADLVHRMRVGGADATGAALERLTDLLASQPTSGRESLAQRLRMLASVYFGLSSDGDCNGWGPHGLTDLYRRVAEPIFRTLESGAEERKRANARVEAWLACLNSGAGEGARNP